MADTESFQDNWKKLELLGSGGQGSVHKVVNVHRNEWLADFLASISLDTPQNQAMLQEKFTEGIQSIANRQYGALKVLHGGIGIEKAEKRMEAEIGALAAVNHRNVVKILDSDIKQRWFVMEYCNGGPLSRHLDSFKSDAIKSLTAIKSLLTGLEALHKKHLIHRDIKTANIFVDDDGELKLGDFGLIFYRDSERTRLSDTMESAGTVDWMAPWAHGQRIEDANPTLDVFSVAKVLYCLVSGREKLLFWHHRKPKNDLEILFPQKLEMQKINVFLDKCICEEEEHCQFPDATAMLSEIDQLISEITFGFALPHTGAKRKCIICGRGTYELKWPTGEGSHSELPFSSPVQLGNFGLNPRGIQQMRLFACNVCGNIQIFDKLI